MICRTCGNSLTDEATVMSLFSYFQEGITFADMILSCSDVKIEEDDSRPQQICEDCIEELQIAFTFRIKCINTDKKFKQYLNDFEIIVFNDECQEEEEDEGHDEIEFVDTKELHLSTENLEISKTIKKEIQEVKEILNDIDKKTAKATTNEKDKMSILLKNLEKSLQQTEAMVEDYAASNSENQETGQIIEYTITEIPGQEVEEEYFVEFLVDDEKKTASKLQSQTPEQKQESRRKKISLKYSCCSCSVTFSSNAELTEHLKIHSHRQDVRTYIENTFRCNLCHKNFEDEKDLEKHSKFYVEKDLKIIPTVVKSTNSNYELESTSESRCCGCKSVFETPEELKQHSVEVHESFRSSVIREDRQYECDICFKCYTSALFLENHRIAPYRIKKFTCENCDTAFPTKHLLNVHEKTHLDITYKCKDCGKEFHNINSFNTHTRKHKEGEYVCQTCGKVSTTKQKHADHLTIHSDLMPFSCSLCNKKFKRRDLVRTHMRVHTGEKRYGCKYCEKVFAHWSDCKRHEMTHTKDYPYQCSICRKQFSRKTHWQAHEANHLK